MTQNNINFDEIKEIILTRGLNCNLFKPCCRYNLRCCRIASFCTNMEFAQFATGLKRLLSLRGFSKWWKFLVQLIRFISEGIKKRLLVRFVHIYNLRTKCTCWCTNQHWSDSSDLIFPSQHLCLVTLKILNAFWEFPQHFWSWFSLFYRLTLNFRSFSTLSCDSSTAERELLLSSTCQSCWWKNFDFEVWKTSL